VQHIAPYFGYRRSRAERRAVVLCILTPTWHFMQLRKGSTRPCHHSRFGFDLENVTLPLELTPKLS
jgi:hypothetical protein